MFLVTVIVTLLIFLVMITLHEFGHFLMAKSLGVNVLEFSIGMGPAIFKKQGRKTPFSYLYVTIDKLFCQEICAYKTTYFFQK